MDSKVGAALVNTISSLYIGHVRSIKRERLRQNKIIGIKRFKLLSKYYNGLFAYNRSYNEEMMFQRILKAFAVMTGPCPSTPKKQGERVGVGWGHNNLRSTSTSTQIF